MLARLQVPQSWYSTVTGVILMFQQDNSDLLSAISQERFSSFPGTETTVNARDMTIFHHSCPDYKVHMTSHALEKTI